MEPAAEEGGNAGVGVDDIRLFPLDHIPEDRLGLPHIPQAAPVEGGGVMVDVGGGDLRDVNAPIGDDHHLMALVLQLLGELHDVGLRAANIQTHGGH